MISIYELNKITLEQAQHLYYFYGIEITVKNGVVCLSQ